MSKRQITTIGGEVEYKPGPYRQVTAVGAEVEYKPGPYRQVTAIVGMVEYTPCIENPGDYGYAEKHFYLEKLQYLKDNHGSQVDLTPYQGCISTEQLVELSLLYVDEVLKTPVMSAIAFLIRPLFGL